MIIPRLYELYGADGTEICEGYANKNLISDELIDNDLYLESSIANCRYFFEIEIEKMESNGDRLEDYIDWVLEEYPVYYKVYLEHEEYVDYELVDEGEIPIDNQRLAELIRRAA